MYGHLRKANFLKLGFIPKKMFDETTQKYIGLKEMYEKKIVNFTEAEQFEKAKISLINNSKTEVLNYFEEVLEIYNSGFKNNLIYSAEQEEFWKIVTFYEPETKGNSLILENCFIGRDFLRKNLFYIS